MAKHSERQIATRLFRGSLCNGVQIAYFPRAKSKTSTVYVHYLGIYAIIKTYCVGLILFSELLRGKHSKTEKANPVLLDKGMAKQ